LTWTILRLIWESRGYSMKEIPDRLKARWPDRKGLAFTSIHRKASEGKQAPSDIAEFVMDEKELPTREGYEKPSKVVRLGLAALRGHLGRVVGKLDALVSALLAKLASTEAKVDAANGKIDSTLGQIGALQAALNHTDAKVDLVLVRLEQLMAYLAMLAKRAVLGVGIGFAVIVTCQRVSPTAPSSAPAPQINLIVERGRGADNGLERENDDSPGAGVRGVCPASRRALAGSNMGQSKSKAGAGRPMPHAGLRGQAISPCQGSETTLYGFCWVETRQSAPCPSDQFQEGEKCYRPIHEPPRKPESETTQPPNPEHR